MSNIKNYTEQGGGRWVVNGSLEIAGEGELILGGKAVAPAAHQVDSTATTIAELKTDFNALLAKLQAAGLMAGSDG